MVHMKRLNLIVVSRGELRVTLDEQACIANQVHTRSRVLHLPLEIVYT